LSSTLHCGSEKPEGLDNIEELRGDSTLPSMAGKPTKKVEGAESPQG